MRKAGKSLQKSVARRGPVSIFDRVGEMPKDVQLSIARQIKHGAQPEADRKLGRVENYKRALQFGDASETQHIIDEARQNKLADLAVREHIAEMIDQGREQELTTQLRAYAIMYLVSPIEIMRHRDG
jgi:hypothetical protein